jgi:DNA-binding transcriptional regulator YdaS (Cro superfamily)
MSYIDDTEVTLTTTTSEQDRLQNIEDLMGELEELRAGVVESLGDAANGVTDQAYRKRVEGTMRRLVVLDGDLHVADFAPEWVVEFRGLLLDSVRALQTQEPLDAYDRLLLNAEAIRHLLRDAIDGHVRGTEDNIGLVVEQLMQWLPRVSQSEMAGLMGISTRQLQRWAVGNATPSRRAQLVARLVAILRRSWTPEGVVAWFYRRRGALDDHAPIDVLNDPAYEQQLFREVRQGRAQHGS